MIARLRLWAKTIKRDILALYLAARDPRVPWHAKLLAGATAAYAFSPIDLIPDFIPVLGLLDDLVILPVAIALTIRLIPVGVMADLRTQAAARFGSGTRKSWGAAVAILGVWIAAAWFAAWAFGVI